MPYIGQKGEALTKSVLRKLRRCCKAKDVEFRVLTKTSKVFFFTNTKDKTPLLSQSNVVYQFTCPACNDCYIGKTDRTLYQRTAEHACNKDSAIHDHLISCEQFQFLLQLYNLPCTLFNTHKYQGNLFKYSTGQYHHN